MEDEFRTYPARWEGQLVLACKKCSKKLKGNQPLHALFKMKKTIKRHNKEHPDRALHVLNVPCMDLCPKDGVAIFQPAHDPHRLMILRNIEDVERLSR
jgi:predicted metal-binding protein